MSVTELFEIEDYTSSGPLEKFVSTLEDFIHQWGLDAVTRSPPLKKNSLSNANWCRKTERIKFRGRDFDLEYHFAQVEETDGGFSLAEEDLEDKRQLPVAMDDLADRANDFMPRGHPLALWFSFRRFLVLSPSSISLVEDSDVKTLSSAINLALINTNCDLPFLVEINHKWRSMFTGAIIGAGCSTEIDIVHLNRKTESDHCEVANLSSLLHIFKSKIRSPIPLPVQLSIRLTYAVQFPFPFSSKAVRIGKYSSLPWGCMISPIEYLQLSTSWPILSEDLVTDTPEYSDLDPHQAPQWSVRPVYNNHPKTSMATTLNEFINLWAGGRETIYYLSQIGYQRDQGSMTSGGQEANPLDKISGGSTLGGVTGNLTGYIDNTVHQEGRSVRIHDEIENILAVTFSVDQGSDCFTNRNVPDLDQGMKSCPRNSLLQKLTLAIFHGLMSDNETGVKYSLLWVKFVDLLRLHLDDVTLLPSVESKHPQLQYSLLQQKIEMLQYCIKCRLTREGKETNFVRKDSIPESQDPDTMSDEEFFDAEDESAEEIPEGREKSTSMFLLKFPDRPLFTPLTQQAPPMTEDMLDRQQEQLMNEGAENRVLMQSQMLSSDMSAFKSANPGALFEDFVRWHSPSDYSDQAGLSARMTLPGNHWMELWCMSKSEPISRQRRVFDDTVIAQEILSELQNASVEKISALLAPSIIHEALVTAVNNIPSGELSLHQMIPIQDTIKLSQHDALSIKVVEDVADQLSTVETFQGRLTWLDLNFSESGDSKEIIKAFNKSFLSSPETVIQGAARGPIAKIILEKIHDSDSRGENHESHVPAYSLAGLTPSNREYILRATVNRPVAVSAKLPQRLYASVTPSEFRMAGAFSSDNTFFF